MAVDELAKADGADGADVDASSADDARRAADGEGAHGAATAVGLGAVRDIAVTMSMEVGRVRMTIAELVRLGEGSVVELERLADEPLDVFVNGTLVARGEAVVVGERFGIRLTEVVGDAGLASS